MKRKKFMDFIRHVFSFWEDEPAEASEDMAPEKKRKKTHHKTESGEIRVPVIRNDKLVEFRVMRSEEIERIEKEELGRKSVETMYSGSESTWSGIDSETETVPTMQTQPQPSPSDARPVWNGMPGWPENAPEVTHDFTNEDLQATNGKIVIHWAHKVSTKGGNPNSATIEGGRRRIIYCKGTLACSDKKCKLQERVKVRTSGLLKIQQTKMCPCGQKKEYIKCPLTCQIFVWRDGARLINTMAHNHKPPIHLLHLLAEQQERFDNHIIAHPQATPLQLVIGAPGLTGPGESVADISPVLQNTGRVGVERRNVLNKTVGTGGDSFFRSFERLQRECPGFVRKAVICEGPVTVICFQTDFMRSLLVRNGIIDEPINGIVTDGAHKFFRHAILIITSTYSLDMSRWVPCLFSYSTGATAAHYAVHFLTLFESMAEECEEQQIEIVDELFAGVMDFSDAQRLGFIQAFVEFWKAQPQDARTVDELKGAAPALLRGCTYHFQKTTTRISKISRIVPPDRAQEFKKRVKSMFRAETDKQFRKIVKTIIKQFPGTKPWFEWWLREAHAVMLFPSQRKMKTELWDSLPSTTNAEESIHNTLRIGHGNFHDFFQGSYALFGQAGWLQKTSDAERAGVSTRYGAKEPHKDRADRYGVTKAPKNRGRGLDIPDEENDRGRPPDTIEELLPNLKKTKRKRSQQRLSTRRQQIKATFKDRLQQNIDNSRRDIESEKRKASRAAALKRKKQLSPSQTEDTGSESEGSDQDIGPALSGSETATSSDSEMPSIVHISGPKPGDSLATSSKNDSIPSYPFSGNSCWLDTSLSLLYAALIPNWIDFCILFKDIPETNHLHSLFLCLQSRHDLDESQDLQETCKILGAQRSAFRKELLRIGAIHTASEYDAQPLWSWLPDTARKAADKVAKTYAPCAYFELLKTEVHSCSGSESTGGEHVQIVTPARREVLRQLTRTNHKAFDGDVGRWFSSLLSLDRTGERSNCWRVSNGDSLCDGGRRDIRNLVLSIPVILIIEVADDEVDGAPWNFPEALYPCHHFEAITNHWDYELIGLGMHSKGASHFIGRFASADRETVYSYNDLNGGQARAIPKATVSSHLAGDSIPLSGDYKVCSAVYRLTGGTDAQLTFFRERKAAIAARYDVKCYSETLEQWPTLDYARKGFEEMDPSERSWMSNPFAASTQEYIKNKKSHEEEALDSPLPPESEELDDDGAAPMSPTTPSKNLPLEQADEMNNTPKTDSSGPNEDFDFSCRCGLVGDANALYRGGADGEAVCCEQCKKWCHIACQRNGRAYGLSKRQRFLCDECDPEAFESQQRKASEEERKKRAKLHSISDLPPLPRRLKAGNGALVRRGTFWYPVRLIQHHVEHLGRGRKTKHEWTVRWWRGCKFDSPGVKPGSVSKVSQNEIVDALWLDRDGRRKIRLGKWIHPSYGYDKTEEILSDPSSVPYTEDVHNALLPHQGTLSALLKAPESIGEDVNIPARHLFNPGMKAYEKTAVGGVSITDRARIANWFEAHISKDRKIRAKWIGLLPMAHAITLYLADQMYQEAIEKEKLKGRSPEDFLLKAWELQKSNSSAPNALFTPRVVDVDAECLAELEEQMFERSEIGGIASYYQWGLDAGDHQRCWDPWSGTPSTWCRYDFAPWDETELERGADYIEDQVPEVVEVPRVIKPPKPRPIHAKPTKKDGPTSQKSSKGLKSQAVLQPARRTQPSRGQK